MSRPYVIGLTGNIATGKSTVAGMLRELGAEVIDADQVAHDLMRPSTGVYRAVVARFGEGILRPDGAIDRSKLGEIVFGDPRALRDLERIVHPAVVREILDRVQRAARDVVVVEAVKLVESGLDRYVDTLWVTVAPPEVQVQRLTSLRGLSIDEAWRRIRAQPPQEERARVADVVIDTRGSLPETRRQVERAWRRARAALRQRRSLDIGN
ncbi:MAG TPA: dephospho-CoA kinase [Chloroflexota bacterium]